MSLQTLLIRACLVVAMIVAAFISGCVEGRGQVQAKWEVARAEQSRIAFDAAMAARAKEKQMNDQLQEAQHAAVVREEKLRADYAAAHAAALGLRNTVTALRGDLSRVSAEACRSVAEAALDVFSQCADQYREVAEEADRLGTAAQTLNEAWPRDPDQ